MTFGRRSAHSMVCCVVWAALSVGCGGGDDEPMTVPCDEALCNETCIGDGDDAGRCVDDSCVCQSPVDLPEGTTAGLSSGGAVRRESARFQLDVTVGPVAPAAERAAGDRDVELGVQPQLDPERLNSP
ncbi:MAG: hypothetical protein JRH11_08735 [Deltaproteobacteria bacterium]|nr:hypothetical protein [Deltaproteobacteria bacterium]